MTKKRLVVSILGTLVLALVLVVAVEVWRLNQGTKVQTVSVAPSQVKAVVAAVLGRGGVGGEEMSRGDDSRLVAGIIEARGVSESGGFHGDGMDWYEAKLSPELTLELKQVLEREASREQPSEFPLGNAPDWFPRTFPSGTLFYKGGKRLEWLALPPGEDRIWVVRMRT
ncbi:MAG: hypothetical protein H0X66_03315 [Verrucomicrobia bacterium]|nr:hypothetical protein [Verrucomicrobiota bacterium]